MTEFSTQLAEPFVPGNEKDAPGFDVLPPGKYQAEVTHATVGPMKNGKGTLLSLTWTITEGDYEKRLVFQTCILQHTESEEAVLIGRSALKRLCEAVGIEALTDLDDLRYKACIIQVGIEKDKTGAYPDKNRVRNIFAVSMSKPAAKPQAAPQATAKPQANGGDINDKIPF